LSPKEASDLHFLFVFVHMFVHVPMVHMHFHRRVIARQDADAACPQALDRTAHMAGAPILTQVQPTQALAGVPVNSAALASSPARTIILRMDESLLEEPPYYATGTAKYQAERGLADAAHEVLNRF
jgi:hypothetical protein